MIFRSNSCSMSFANLWLEKQGSLEEELPVEAFKLPAFKSPMRSLSFEDDEYIVTDYKPNFKPQTKCLNENLLLDTHENHCNPDIPTISCHTV